MTTIAQTVHTLAVLAFPAVLALGAVYDLASYRIPNWLSLALLAAFAVAVPAAGLGVEETLWRLGAGGAVFVVGFGLFVAGLLGGGDVKIMAAAGPWVGWSLMAPFLLLTALAGGALALALLILRRPSVASRLSGIPGFTHLLAKDEGIPYGVAIAVAGGVVFLRSLGAKGLFDVSFF